MAKPKNTNKSIAVRLSINITLDDVGLDRLYSELLSIENKAGHIDPNQIHALKRRHLLKILHVYCSESDSKPSVFTANERLDGKKEMPLIPIHQKSNDISVGKLPVKVSTPQYRNHSQAESDAINKSIAAGMGSDFELNRSG